MTNVKWKVWYGDGTTWCDEDGPPELGPPLGVVIVRYWDKDGGIVDTLIGADWYYWDDGYPMSGDIHGLVDQLMQDTDRSVHGLKQGRWLRPPQYFEITDAAARDPYIPQHGDISAYKKAGG